MSNIVLHLRNNTPNKAPQASDLKAGQIAINTADGDFYTLDATGAVQKVASSRLTAGVSVQGTGTAAAATGTNSVAIGFGSEATDPDTVSVGKAGALRRIVNVSAGTANTDVAVVGQIRVPGRTYAPVINAKSDGAVVTIDPTKSVMYVDNEQQPPASGDADRWTTVLQFPTDPTVWADGQIITIVYTNNLTFTKFDPSSVYDFPNIPFVDPSTNKARLGALYFTLQFVKGVSPAKPAFWAIG
jgi:hypothetical protein